MTHGHRRNYTTLTDVTRAMTHLSVHEWDRVPIHNGPGEAPPRQFTRAQAEALVRAAAAHRHDGMEGAGILADHHHHLSVRQMVGIIAAPGCSLEILPKIDQADTTSDETLRGRLVHMLDVALGLDLGVGMATEMARQSRTLLDILIRLFADRLIAETRRGLPRAYLAHEEDLGALRGRLDVARQFTAHAVRPDRLACRFDTLSSDIPLLKIMKACVLALRRHARAPETIRRLDELRFVLADIGDVSVSALPWNQVRIDRTNRRWEALLNLAKLFLKREWQTTHHASNAAEGITLVFPMNTLFEAYMAALLKRALRKSDVTVQAQGGLLSCLIEEGDNPRPRFQTKPDILIKRGKQTLAVIDTKWKRIGTDPEDKKHGVSQSDVYQMMAYGRIYTCPELVLLYPHHGGLGSAPFHRGYRVTGCNDRLRLATIDITQDQNHIEAQLATLADSLISETAQAHLRA